MAPENDFQEAIEAWDSGQFNSLAACARQFDVPYDTFRRRVLGHTRPHSSAHENQQILTSAEEEVLIKYMVYSGQTGHACSVGSLRHAVKELSNRENLPSRDYIYALLKRHPELKLKKPSTIDPKRARAFNRPVVEHHFKLLDEFLKENNISWDNVWNMDEKGLQAGGGRKNNGRKYFYSREQRSQLRIKDDELELVTVIQCVSANGGVMPPGFVFAGKRMCPNWFRTGNGNEDYL